MRRSLSLALLVALFALVPASRRPGRQLAGVQGGSSRRCLPTRPPRRRPDPRDVGGPSRGPARRRGHRRLRAGSSPPPSRERWPVLRLAGHRGPYHGGTRLPAAAIRLAPFEIRWTSNRFSTVHARFTVPAVPSGEYEVLVCDDPCTFPGFGEFVEGWVALMQTPDEARLLTVARERNGRARELSQKVKHLQGEVVALGSELEAAGTELRERTLHAREAASRSRRSRPASRPHPTIGRWSRAGPWVSSESRSSLPRST